MPEGASTEALLRQLEWTVIRRLDGLLQGEHRTLMRGAGFDLADLREYQHHDDVRHIDWNVTARLQIPHVRARVGSLFLREENFKIDFRPLGALDAALCSNRLSGGEQNRAAH